MVWLAAARMSVLPSGGALAAKAVPMVLPAPGRFSTITFRPSCVPSSALMARARMSCTPPAENSAKSPTFKKVYESQRAYAAKVVPAKRYMFPPYSFAANYYWPQENAKPAAAKGKSN